MRVRVRVRVRVCVQIVCVRECMRKTIRKFDLTSKNRQWDVEMYDGSKDD